MILLFLGTWRNTLGGVVSIPLSIFCSIICLYAHGQTINATTLGGLALAAGILVDDATVEIVRYKAGLVSSIEVIDSQRTQLAGEISLTQARAARLSATVLLVRALGGGW
ncbi:MAG TPA: efflux RND transporter permease subunit [Opitutaceae bacterium]